MTKTKLIKYKGFIYAAAPIRWECKGWTCTNKDESMGSDPTFSLEKDDRAYYFVFSEAEKLVSMQVTDDSGLDVEHKSIKVDPWVKSSAYVATLKLCVGFAFLRAPKKECLDKLWALMKWPI